MYILKNALRSISRSKGRNLLIGIIVFVIAVSACLGLSIRQAARTAEKEALEGVTITAQISVDRSSMMSNMKNQAQGGFDKDAFKEALTGTASLTVEEMLEYAELDSVEDFYYAATISMNGNDDFEPVSSNSSSGTFDVDDESTEDEEDNSESNISFGNNQSADIPQMGGMDNSKELGGFQMGTFGTQGDFTVVGYSSDSAMTDFINKTSYITDGVMFDEGTEEYQCVISDELAAYNDLGVGDEITIVNPNNEEESYTLSIVGIYVNTQSTVSQSNMMGGFSTSTDSANQIYLSYNALKNILDISEENAEVTTDENTGITTTTAIPEQVSGTYVFATAEDYGKFAEEVYEAGLSEEYAVSSSDASQYEQSIVPLENLSAMSMYFLAVVLGIGAVVLIVLNIFSVRERKYEVGALTAIGMKKYKVSLQFLTEILTVTIVAVFLGAIVGSVTSVPVTNALLASQIAAQESEADSVEEAFGRQQNMGGMQGNIPDNMQGGKQPDNLSIGNKNISELKTQAVEYISEVSSATDFSVLLKLLGIGVALALAAGAASVIFIMRYDPLKILANRD